MIVSLGFVDGETVEQAVEAARAPGQMVDRILLGSGALTEEELSSAGGAPRTRSCEPRSVRGRHGAASLIGSSTALRYRAVPIAFATDGALIVAVADPVDALAISDIEVMTKMETRRAVASGVTIDRLAERLPEVGPRQPAADQSQAAGAAPPAPPASPSVGPSSVEHASSPNGDARERGEASRSRPRPRPASSSRMTPPRTGRGRERSLARAGHGSRAGNCSLARGD